MGQANGAVRHEDPEGGDLMYTIILGLDGRYYCWGKLQDGTERWTENNLEAAIKSMKDFARFANHTKIKRKDIEFFQEQPVMETKYVPWKL